MKFTTVSSTIFKNPLIYHKIQDTFAGFSKFGIILLIYLQYLYIFGFYFLFSRIDPVANSHWCGKLHIHYSIKVNVALLCPTITAHLLPCKQI